MLAGIEQDIARLERRLHEIRQNLRAAKDEQEKMAYTRTQAGIVPLALIEKEAILRAVVLIGDNVKAAKLLGIGKTTLYRKLKEYREG